MKYPAMDWMPQEYRDQWTPEAIAAWQRMRKSFKEWKASKTAPSDSIGSVKENGQLTPLFIPNDYYIKYQEDQAEWRKVQPDYFFKDQARMSKGDFDVGYYQSI